LKTIVFEEIVFAVFFAWYADFFIVDEFGQALVELLAERDFVEVRESDFVFGFNPSGYFGSGVVFHPRVRVVDFGAEIGVDSLGFASFGIRDSLFVVSAT
jgi:hypothetical protein